MTIKKSPIYIGAEINKSSRYCGIAHSYGLVIDAADFPVLPESLEKRFFKQARKLPGINDILDIWVTEEIYTQFLTIEELKETPEVYIGGHCCPVYHLTPCNNG